MSLKPKIHLSRTLSGFLCYLYKTNRLEETLAHSLMLYRLFVGADNATRRLNGDAIVSAVKRFFKGFTVYETVGHWEGAKEPSLCVEIDTDEKDRIKALADLIKKEQKQDAVLVQSFVSNSVLV